MNSQNIQKDQKTIQDFGAQWTRFRENSGYYASNKMFADIIEPFFRAEDFENKCVVEIGSGTGRIVRMILEAGASKVTAVEPSDAFYVLSEKFSDEFDRVELIHGTAQELKNQSFDLVLSIGVIHHIPDPDPTIQQAFDCLRPGGQVLVWLYGEEGNAAYLSWVLPLRKLTNLLPDALLVGVSHALTGLLSMYALLCRVLPLPMHKYMINVILMYPWKHRMLTIFDQLNPDYAKYYTKEEAENLLTKAGFTSVKSFHRHSYSWLVTGKRSG